MCYRATLQSRQKGLQKSPGLSLDKPRNQRLWYLLAFPLRAPYSLGVFYLFNLFGRQLIFGVLIKGTEDDADDGAHDAHNAQPDNLPDNAKACYEAKNGNVNSHTGIFGHFNVFIFFLWQPILCFISQKASGLDT